MSFAAVFDALSRPTPESQRMIEQFLDLGSKLLRAFWPRGSMAFSVAGGVVRTKPTLDDALFNKRVRDYMAVLEYRRDHLAAENDIERQKWERRIKILKTWVEEVSA